VVLGSSLTGTPVDPFGKPNQDFESFPYFRYAYYRAYGGTPRQPPSAVAEIHQLLDPFATAAGRVAFPLVPVNGVIKSFTVKGATHQSNIPGPNGAGDMRLGVDRPLADGRLKVISTSDPSAELPRQLGVHTFRIGRPYTGFTMYVHRGDVLSLDTPGGSYAVWARVPGAEMETVLGHGGSEQSPGVIWTGTAHPNVELLMRVTIQPSVSTARLHSAKAKLQSALAAERHALAGRRAIAAKALAPAATILAAQLHEVAAALREGAVSAETAATIGFYLHAALAHAAGRSTAPLAALAATRAALGDVVRATALAQRVP
jgi:hypothetical protein